MKGKWWRSFNVQRGLKETGKPCRAFEVLNLSKYERRFFMANLTNGKYPKSEKTYVDLILEAYKAIPIQNYKTSMVKKSPFPWTILSPAIPG
jgi:hypothetical protein